MKKNRKGFTLAELVIVIMILAILSVIGMVTYTTQLASARNSARISDMANILVSLKNYKMKKGEYPLPGGNKLMVEKNGTGIIQQGFFNENIAMMEITKIPQDPLVKGQYYMYSTLANRQFLQIAMILEDSDESNNLGMKAFVDGDFKSPNAEWIPSIIFATGTSDSPKDLSNLSKYFIVDNGILNIPYDENGNTQSTATSTGEILEGFGVNIPKYYGAKDCDEIKDLGLFLGDGEYQTENGKISCSDK